MAIMVGDTISTIEGRSRIKEILHHGINQHALWIIYFFENGCTARLKWYQNRCHMKQAINMDRNMVFKPSEPIEAWTAGEYWDEAEECWC